MKNVWIAERRVGDEGNWGNAFVIFFLDPFNTLSNKVCMGKENRKRKCECSYKERMCLLNLNLFINCS